MDAEKANQVALLKHKLKGFISDVKSIVEQGRLIANDPSQLFLFKGMYIHLKNYFDSFQETWETLVSIHLQAKAMDDFPTETEKIFPAQIKRYYYEACAIYESHMNPTPLPSTLSPSTPANLALNASQLNQSVMLSSLPRITLPNFAGEQSDWPMFRDTFRSRIHDNPNISSMDKYLLLIGSLKGPALSLLKGVPVEEKSYDRAWKVLKENFDDRRRLATGYLKVALNFPPFRNKPTAASLRHLITTVIESINAFKQLEVPDADDFILTHLLLRCLDSSTRKDFETKVSGVEFPKLQQLVDFIKGEWRTLDITYEDASSQRYQPSTPFGPRSSFQTKTSSSSRPSGGGRRAEASLFADDEKSDSSLKSQYRKTTPRPKPAQWACPVCKANHTLYHCNSFKNAPAAEKRDLLQNWTGCVNCLSGRHKIDACTSTRRCQSCNGKHHSWLHVPERETNQGDSTKTKSAALSGTSFSGETILGTALVKIRDARGKFQIIRLVTDCGSQHSFITRKCAERLGLTYTSAAPVITGIGQTQLSRTYGVLSCTLRSRLHRGELRTDAIVVPDITGHLPHIKLPHELHNHLSAYELADPAYWKPQEIDFLLGGDLYFDIITGAPLTVRADFPKLVPSLLGYIVAGRCSIPADCSPHVSLFVNNAPDIREVMAKFWEFEELPPDTPLSKEEAYCEQHFKENHYRLSSGRYGVALPFKPTISTLQNPKKQVVSRLINLEYKLSHRPELRAEYHKFMEEWPAPSPGKYLIPHHSVTKIEDGKTKLRVVFDASCRGGGGSLNDHLMVGPKLQRDIADIILIFRTFLFALVADIVKMYRQIMVRQEDRAYQHILWRSDPEEELAEWELLTLTYGESSAAYLAQRCVRQLKEDEGSNYPLAAAVLEDSIYVDDVVTGANSLKEALLLQEELIQLLKRGCFHLSKWKSNCPEILANIPEPSDDNSLSLCDAEESSCKILGLQWSAASDTFTFEVQRPTTPPTKRGILSTIARIYDPLGFIAPVVFRAKTILQEVWFAQCAWDQQVPANLEMRWSSFADELRHISNVSIPRIVCPPDCVSYILTGFSDASERGFAAVVYLTATCIESGKTHLLKAKTKLAPAKLSGPAHIPRLELCGAVLLARLLRSCHPLISKLQIDQVHLFTDSKVVLGWLRLPFPRLKAFVAHRVSEILEATGGACWHHVAGDQNPADCASRGLAPEELIRHPLWWTGPPWLQNSMDQWPSSDLSPDDDLPETKPPSSTALLADEMPDILQWMSRWSSYPKVIRILSYALRFPKRTRGLPVTDGRLTLREMDEATMLCTRLVQDQHLSSNKALLSSKYWKSLAPFKDARGLFRVGGRLQHALVPFSVQHPLILPDCHYTRTLIDHYHRIHLHVGPYSLQALIQRHYFIISARKIVRARIRRCVTCQVASPKPQAPFMGSLPACRLQEGQVFQNVGVDLAGPFLIKESNRRKASLGKAYLCLFICMVTRAIHLEVVTSCSTESFLAALERFIARRGKPLHVYSDGGTNFVGAAASLKAVRSWIQNKGTQDTVVSFCHERAISWHFNPPRAPHFGGLWEAGIKSAKSLLIKNVGATPLTYEELSTLFGRIEAVLNSRPIGPISSEPDSLECLTPGHFLIGRPITSLPEQSLLHRKENQLKRWQLVQQRVQHFWTRWRTEYLHQLQQRRKWITSRPNLQVGDLVVLKDSDCPPTTWPVGRIVDTHPGHDGVVRVATVRTASGSYKRPSAKLVPLLLPHHDSSSTI